MYDISISGYKVIKTTWGGINATSKPYKLSICASTQKGKKLYPVAIVSDIEGLRQTISRLTAGEPDYISIRASIEEPTGAHWQLYYKLIKENAEQ